MVLFATVSEKASYGLDSLGKWNLDYYAIGLLCGIAMGIVSVFLSTKLALRDGVIVVAMVLTGAALVGVAQSVSPSIYEGGWILPSNASTADRLALVTGIAGVHGTIAVSYTFAALNLLRFFLDRRPIKKMAVSATVAEITSILANLYETRPLPMAATNLSSSMTSLERIAVLIGRGFPKMAPASAEMGRRAMEDRCQQAAFAVREYQTWVALPGYDTNRDLTVKLVALLGAICHLELNSLPTPSSEFSVQAGKSKVALNTLRTIAVGILPLAVTLALKWSKLLPPAPLDSFVILISTLWALVYLMILLDPLFSARVSVFKDFVSVFRGGSGGNRSRP
ncbi:hypothetical protein Val02_57660 [Virgisporangium aliadipatigenens]|uniref:Uncharacterized protein n=2 Tax=Virgisporangium aliadipatigenens TaxID=741659 RepID=A0A8J4DS62_9ACTN|nr:hypothetical protein Val02_57660 [Virgisporangium aliadipatigenens]